MTVETRRIGPTLRRLRQARGMRMIDVAFEAGLSSDSEVSKLENDKTPNIAWHKLARVLKALGVTWEEFETEVAASSFNGPGSGSLNARPGNVKRTTDGRDGPLEVASRALHVRAFAHLAREVKRTLEPAHPFGRPFGQPA